MFGKKKNYKKGKNDKVRVLKIIKKSFKKSEKRC